MYSSFFFSYTYTLSRFFLFYFSYLSSRISSFLYSADDLPEYVAHPEDLDLDNEPTLFEQVMTAAVDDSSDDEDDDEDEADERDSPIDDE